MGELMQQMSGGLDDKMKDQLKKGLNPVLNEVDSEGGVTVQPTPGYVVKTEDMQSGQKIFINVCCSDFVEKPHEKSLPTRAMRWEFGFHFLLEPGRRISTSRTTRASRTTLS